jgi:hypothetical protein
MIPVDVRRDMGQWSMFTGEQLQGVIAPCGPVRCFFAVSYNGHMLFMRLVPVVAPVECVFASTRAVYAVTHYFQLPYSTSMDTTSPSALVTHFVLKVISPWLPPALELIQKL